MAEPSIFDAVTPNTNASQREALRALAQGGTQAKNAYLAAQAAQQSDRASVLQDILQRATALGAPAAGAEMQAAATPRLDARSAALAASQGSNATLLDSLRAGNERYFGEVSAALPIVRGRAEQQIAAQRFKAEQEELDRQLQLQLRMLSLREAETSLQSARERAAAERAGRAGESALSDSELSNRLLGAGRIAQEQAAGQVPRYRSEVPKQLSRATVSLVNRADRAAEKAAMTPESLAREIGLAAGLDPSRVYGVIDGSSLSEADKDRARALARTNLTGVVERNTKPGAFFEFKKAFEVASDADPENKFYGDPLAYVRSLKESYLKRHGTTRDLLANWVEQYMAI